MKLLRYGFCGSEKPGVIDKFGNIRDLSSHIDDINVLTIGDFSKWQELRALDLTSLPLVKDVRIGAPIMCPGKLIFIGFNSTGHAAELGVDVKNTEPTMFLKPNSSIIGPHDPIIHSKIHKKLDWEAELAIIIGKKGKYIPIDKAADYIFGYTCCNDLSDRHLQFDINDTQFTKGKCFDGSAILGPHIVTKEDITDSSNLEIKLWVNGELRQDFNSGNYIFNDLALISIVSKYFTLYPGDVISMGSGPGSAKAWGNRYLQPSDSVELDISKIGSQKQAVIKEEF